MPNVKESNKSLPKTAPQASMLWRLEAKYSPMKPFKWYEASLTRQQASDLIGLFVEWEKEQTNADKAMALTSAMQVHNPEFKLRKVGTDTRQEAPKEVTKEVTKTVTITSDMPLDKIIETILPVVKGATHIKDIYDAKQPKQVKAETSKEYFKPEIFDNVLQALRTPEINVLIKGPAGSGKSLMGAELAKRLNLEFFAMSCSGSMKYGHVIGADKLFVDPETGQTISKFECSQMVKRFTKPGLTLLDEGFALAADILIGLNGLFEPTTRVIETKAGKIVMHKEHKVMVAANSDGRNIDRNYAGAKRVDGSSLDRFVTFKINYSKRVERNILKQLPKLHREWLAINFNGLRNKIKMNNILFDLSTRRLHTTVKLIAAGMLPHVAFDCACLGQLSATELKKTGFDKLTPCNGEV